MVANTRNVKHNGEWNIEGLLAAHTDADNDVVTCPATGLELYYLNSDGKDVMLRSFGECTECEEIFHVSHMRRPNVPADTWPVEYEGMCCEGCDRADDEEEGEDNED